MAAAACCAHETSTTSITATWSSSFVGVSFPPPFLRLPRPSLIPPPSSLSPPLLCIPSQACPQPSAGGECNKLWLLFPPFHADTLCRSVFLQFGNFQEDADFEPCVDAEGLRSLQECEDLFDEVV